MCNLIYIPLLVCFRTSHEKVIDIASQVFFTAHLIPLLNTSFYSRGTLVSRRSEIILNFVRQHLFKETLVLLSVYYSPPQDEQLRFIKLVFLIKIRDVNAIIIKMRESFSFAEKNSGLINLALLFMQVIIMNHFFACLW
jgi:hypothetical protein